MPEWSFLTSHARVLLRIAHDPGLRLRDIAARLGITERTAHGVLTDLVQAGYVTRTKDGRRNRYQVHTHLPLPEPGTREPSIGELLAVLLGDTPGMAGPAGPADVPEGSDSGSARGERMVNPGSQGRQRGGAGLPGGHPPAAQHQQGGDGLGPEPLRDPR